MASGLMGRQGTSLQANPSNRFGDPGPPSTRNTGDDSRASRGTLGTGFGAMNTGYGSSIWRNSTFASAIPATRPSSRTTEQRSLLSPHSDERQERVGSGALVSTSESDEWGTAWTSRDARSSSSSTSQVRSNGISPVRQRSNNGLPNSQPYRDSSMFAPSRVTMGQVPNRSAHETNASSFRANRSADISSTMFPGTAPYLDTDFRRTAEPSLSSWADAIALQSSPDDRSSIHNSDYFPGSGLQSRDRSLPPSRHGRDGASMSGGEPSQRGHQSQSSFALPRHLPSLSSQTNGGAYNDRLNSQDTDLSAHFRRMSLQQHDQSVNVSRPMLNINGAPTHVSQGSQDLASRHQSPSDFPQLSPFGNNNLANSQSFIPNRVSNMRSPQVRERPPQAPSLNVDYHHSQMYESTPQRGYGSSRYMNGDSRAMDPSQFTLLESRFRGLPQEQNFIPNLPQMITPYQLPHYGQPYQYGPPQGVPGINGLSPFVPINPMQGMVSTEAPKAPRDDDPGKSVRSFVLEEFKTNQKAKRYELKDIFNHIVEFSGDQHGSRFIQNKLETANSEDKENVFREILPEVLQLMRDVFGNYVIQKFFEYGDQVQKRILASKMKGQVFTLSNEMYACRVVQKALEHVLTDQQASIVKELEPRVMDCVKDQNGNHVIQKAIERVPAEHMHFIVSNFIGKVHDLSVHPYGCRVIQRMLEHCEPHIKRSVLQEIQSCEAILIKDQYGNYVTQHAIELGTDEDRARVFELIKSELLTYSKHKYASNVVEAVLKHATNEQRREIMLILTEKNEQGESNLVMMIKDGFANYVIQRLLDTLDKSDYLAFMDTLQPEMVKAKRMATGKQVQAKYQLTLKVAKIEHKMHRLESNHGYGLSIPTPPSISTNVSAATTPPPPLTGSGQSPQSSSLPSTNTSTVDDPVQSTNGGKPITVHEVGIAQ